MNLAQDRVAATGRFSERQFFEAFPKIIDAIFTSNWIDADGDGSISSSNEAIPSLLDRLDQAYENYVLAEATRQEAFLQSRVKEGVASAFKFAFGQRDYEDPNFTNSLIELQLNWSESLDQLDCLLDLSIPGLVSLSIDADGSSSSRQRYKMYTLPIQSVLPAHTVRIFQSNLQGARLSQIYHNLEASAEDQKAALGEGFIILSAWELLCFTLFKALTTPSLFTNLSSTPFFTETCEEEEGRPNIENLMAKVRMDKHRMLVILLTRLLKKLMLQVKEQVHPLESQAANCLTTFCQIADEWLLQPVINHDVFENFRHQKQDLPGNLVTTPGLEFLYCMITELQHPDNLFEEQQRSYMMQPAVSPSLSGTSSYWNPKSTLSLFKAPLYQFLATAFRLSASKALDQSVRLCDIGALYFKLLKPW